jgi:ribonuclease D
MVQTMRVDGRGGLGESPFNMQIIATTPNLAEFCTDLASDSFIAVDTEFMRETTFWPELCLIQIAGQRREAVIDPLAKGIDLSPFFGLMANPKVLKVFHAARQDVEIMVHRSGTVPTPLFDTQVAAMVCGFGDQVSYEQIVRKLAKAQIDKSSRFTDWSRRPLSEKQLAYALSDVTHLRTVYLRLAEQLAHSGREPWLEQEFALLSSPSTYTLHPEEAWKRIKVRLKNKKQLAVLIAVAAWREREAQERNIPRGRVIKDDAVAEIAMQTPQTAEALGHLRALPRGFASSRTGEAILQAVQVGLATDTKTLPHLDHGRDDSRESAQSAAEILKLALKIISEREGIAPKLIASSADIEALAQSQDRNQPLLQGWRREVFGNVALELLSGHALIGFDQGRAAIVTNPLPSVKAAE